MSVETTYCETHPTTETGLRCNRCNKYICAKCAVRTATGYRCRECIREQSKVFDTAKSYDFVISVIVAGAISFIGGRIASTVGFFFFVFLIGSGAGVLIASAVQKVTEKRRSKDLFRAVVVAIVIGGMAPSLFGLLFRFNLFSLIWDLVFVGLAASTAYTRLSGIRLR